MMMSVYALLSLSIVSVLGARADGSVSSLLQTSAVVAESEQEMMYAGERAITISDSDWEDAAKRKAIEMKLRALRRELKVESDLRHKKPSYILPTNATDRISGQDSATIALIESALHRKSEGESDVTFDTAQVQKVLNKLTAQLHGPGKLGHIVSSTDRWCYQGPIPFMNRMIHAMQTAPVFVNSTQGVRVQEGPCPSDEYGPAIPMSEGTRSCFPLADMRYPKDMWDGKDEQAFRDLIETSDPFALYLHSHPEVEGDPMTFTVTVFLSCLSSDML